MQFLWHGHMERDLLIFEHLLPEKKYHLLKIKKIGIYSYQNFCVLESTEYKILGKIVGKG